MSLVIAIVSGICLVVGSVFCVLGGVGLLRFPDFYTRIHAAGMTDTLGAGLILTGLMLQAGWTLTSVKLLSILLFLFLSSPAAAHALAKAAFHGGLKVSGKAKIRHSAFPR